MKQDADTNLKIARKQLQERKRLDQLLAGVQQKKQQAEKQLNTYRHIMEQEQHDVDGLEGYTLKNIIYTMIGSKSKALKKEQQEALRAKLQYDAGTDKRKELERLEAHYLELLKRHQNAREHYEKALNAKRRELTGEVHEKLLIHDERIADLQQEEKELSEAIEAVAPVEGQLKQLEGALETASGWGTFDVFIGDALSSEVKHEHLEKARTLAGNAQKYLEVFQVELAVVDKNFRTAVGIDLPRMNKFLDIFFDNLFTDLSVQKQIRHSLENVRETRRELITMDKALRQEYAAIENELKEAEKEKAQLTEDT